MKKPNNYPTLKKAQFLALVPKMKESKYTDLYLEMDVNDIGEFLTEYVKRDPSFASVVAAAGL